MEQRMEFFKIIISDRWGCPIVLAKFARKTIEIMPIPDDGHPFKVLAHGKSCYPQWLYKTCKKTGDHLVRVRFMKMAADLLQTPFVRTELKLTESQSRKMRAVRSMKLGLEQFTPCVDRMFAADVPKDELKEMIDKFIDKRENVLKYKRVQEVQES